MDDILVDGAKIRSLRQKRRWSQFDLARVSGVDQGTISRLETNNQGDTRIDTLVRISRALGVPTDELFVPAEPLEEEPTDPQLNVMMNLIDDMDENERAQAEMFLRFVLYQRRKRKGQKKRESR